MPQKHALVTTFHPKGYKNYGQKMIATFAKYWPKDVTLYAYWEKEKPTEEYENVVYRDLLDSCPDLVAFINRNKNNPKDNSFQVVQYYEEGAEQKDPRFAGVRCSYKCYCVFHAAEHIDADWIHWVDADTFSIQTVPQHFLDSISPRTALLSFLGREGRDTETGWVGYNVQHPHSKRFMQVFKDRYDSDKVYSEQPYSYDCTTFDIVRTQFEKEGVKTFNISKHWWVDYHANPFLHSPLGKYMRHALGPLRKKTAGGTLERDYSTYVNPVLYKMKKLVKKYIGKNDL